MKPIYVVLIILLGLLQYQLWWADGSVRELQELKSTLAMETDRYQRGKEYNQQLFQTIHALKNNPQEIETRARFDNDMIIEGESYYQIIEK